MNIKEMKARLKAIAEEAKTAEGEKLDTLMNEAQDINTKIEAAANRAKLSAMADMVKDDPESQEAGEKGEGNSWVEARAKALKAGNKATYSFKNLVSSSSTVLPKHTASDIKPTFNEVSSLVDRVRTVPLIGGESYERAYVKNYGEGGYTEEGADYNPAEPVFGYAAMVKTKITAYAEETEEIVKLPNADYDSTIENGTTVAMKKYMSRQILIGNGGAGKFRGIFFNPTESAEQVIDPDTDIAITAIDENTLDEIIYSYGGEEDVEDTAVLILNKKDLKAFTKVRGTDKKKVYTIINHGNTGTIDGVPYIINSACKALSDATTTANSYCMAYGPLSNYELPIFSDIETQRSTDYKFKQGQIAFKGSIFAGGNVAAYNGFLRVKKGA
ncbi:MAG: phage major capsid protein [Eubacterium sp.]|jgi:HK97 family phage major capsid protein|nr:phage major capsid protein [Eubacterium sp.]